MALKTENQKKIERLIQDLPEIYQSIYINGTLVREGIRKNDFERLEIIKSYIKPGQTILEVGSNVGFFTIHLAKKFPDNVFISVEKQRPYARLQKELIKQEGLKNILLIQTEIKTEWLNKAAEACVFFDVTLLMSVLHHIPDAESFLAKLDKVSKSFLVEIPHADESKVCGRDIIKSQLTYDKISKIKPNFHKINYESSTHCDNNLKRSFYFSDTPDFDRTSAFPYIGYPLSPRIYRLRNTDTGLLIHKKHLNKTIQAQPGILLCDVEKAGGLVYPSYRTCTAQIKKELNRLDTLSDVADIRPWNILFTSNGLSFIDYQYTEDLNKKLKYNKFKDYIRIQWYITKIFIGPKVRKIKSRLQRSRPLKSLSD